MSPTQPAMSEKVAAQGQIKPEILNSNDCLKAKLPNGRRLPHANTESVSPFPGARSVLILTKQAKNRASSGHTLMR